ncbi:MAG: RluA family pseudouridine synthase [Magnetococcales bacterium]|nr:RluA family pseudouridine synthase [Magnetococcales bacterium]
MASNFPKSMPSQRRVTVPDACDGQRLDTVLTQLSDDLSRAAVQRLIKDGAVSLDPPVVLTPKRKARAGECYLIKIPEATPAEAQPEPIPLDVIFEDRHLIVVNKPAGLVVHPGAGNPAGTLVNALLHHCDDLSGIGGVLRPGIVHRLDKETSGLLLVAKNDEAHRHLAEQFHAHTITRRYMAILKGRPVKMKGTVDQSIGRHPNRRIKMAVRPPGQGKRAVTHYRVLRRLGPFAQVACRLETGRTHQIRVHMAYLKMPLLGDPLYGRVFQPPGDWPEALRTSLGKFRRQALHAAVLGFEHPVSGERMQFEIPPPEDMGRLMALLEGAFPAG